MARYCFIIGVAVLSADMSGHHGRVLRGMQNRMFLGCSSKKDEAGAHYLYRQFSPP
jgi:hypothetical protein